MLKLNKDFIQNPSRIFSNLNTSHVKVKPLVTMPFVALYSYLNTSHVKVKHIPKKYRFVHIKI